MTMITPSYLGETIEYSSLHACRSTLEDPTYRGPVPIGISWGKDGIVFGQFNRGILRLSPNGGEPEVLVDLKAQINDPQVLPGGESVLFTLADTDTGAEGWNRAHIVVQSVKTGNRKTLVERGTSARYLPTGHIVYADRGNLLAVPFDIGRLEVTGGPVPVVEGVPRSETTGLAHFDVSSNGSLIYLPGPIEGGAATQSLAIVDRAGAGKPLALPQGSYLFPRVSPDGKRIAFSTDDGKEALVWIYEVSGASSMRRLTFGGSNRFPIWSADGQYVAYQSDREGDLGIFRQRADGTGAAERLTKPDSGVTQIPESWSPDGQMLAFTAKKRADSVVWILSLKDKKIVSLTPEAPGKAASGAAFSRDGHWLTYQSNETGRTEIFVQSFPGGSAKYQVSKTADSHHPLWSPDGKELFYIPGPDQFVSVRISVQPSFSFGDPIPQAKRGFLEGGPNYERNYDIMPDGQHFVGVINSSPGQPGAPLKPQIQVVLNWFGELRQRVPVK